MPADAAPDTKSWSHVTPQPSTRVACLPFCNRRACRELTRGQGAFTTERMRAFVGELKAAGTLNAEAAESLAALTPSTYLGNAAAAAKAIRDHLPAGVVAAMA